ncbi:MAG: hypothetical protein QXG39_04065 [Candidatus Aenigmatarchaeota archaeon]
MAFKIKVIKIGPTTYIHIPWVLTKLLNIDKNTSFELDLKENSLILKPKGD